RDDIEHETMSFVLVAVDICRAVAVWEIGFRGENGPRVFRSRAPDQPALEVGDGRWPVAFVKCAELKSLGKTVRLEGHVLGINTLVVQDLSDFATDILRATYHAPQISASETSAIPGF